ncbi:ABC transporter substrate-binding protein [Cerasicoccus fimbriatus]|uniref:ABC transporter substrate-binding protein n=1 Tax=Cerasicoccus fimbriatus TaxID=3014554 RepID=UPI0022B43189|nr:ABC transporter substrate-binding protein [Cerasicoccus sp. TK19100]
MRFLIDKCLIVWRGSFLVTTLVCLLCSPALLAHDDGPHEEKRLEKVTVQLKWLHQFQFAGFYTALEKGYYRDVGLDVELIEGGSHVDPEDVVLQGRADFGIGTPEVLLAFAEGKPVVVLGVIFQHSPYMILTTKESGLGDVSDLVGKRVMIEPQASEIYAYLKRERVPADSLKYLQHTSGVEELISGEVDAMSAYSTTEPYFLKEAGIDYFYFSPRSGGVDFYGDCLFTTKSMIEERPKLVERFYAATLKGWQDAMANPEEAVDLILEKWPTKSSREALLFEAQGMADLMHPELIPIGYMYEGRWEHIRDTFIELGMLRDAISLDGFLYRKNLKPDLTWYYISSGAAVLLAVIAFCVLFPLWRLNRRLRNEVKEHERTSLQLIEAKDAAERANRAKRQFVAQVSHDLRTPLNCILGFSELLLDDEKDIERRGSLMAIRSAGKSLLRMVDELLRIDQIESGRIAIAAIDFLIDDVTDPLMELLESSARGKGLILLSVIQAPLAGDMVGDPEKLRQILLNLMGNAIKFTEAGEVTLTVLADGDGMVRFKVEDSGPGIPPDMLDSIFEPFVRDVKQRHKEGAGLGLAIVKRMAKAMGGDVIATNTGHGALFELTLPLTSSKKKGLFKELGFEELAGQQVGVALDDSAWAQAVRGNLASLGLQLHDAHDAADCSFIIADKRQMPTDAFEQPVVALEPHHPVMSRRILGRYLLAAR